MFWYVADKSDASQPLAARLTSSGADELRVPEYGKSAFEPRNTKERMFLPVLRVLSPVPSTS